ncbi:MAG: hypothetical protein U0168_05515 [Nannocystaceae bacterium]
MTAPRRWLGVMLASVALPAGCGDRSPPALWPEPPPPTLAHPIGVDAPDAGEPAVDAARPDDLGDEATAAEPSAARASEPDAERDAAGGTASAPAEPKAAGKPAAR